MPLMTPLNAALICVLLAGCAVRVPVPEPGGFRRENAPIASVALFETARFAGRWYQTGGFPGVCAGQVVDVEAIAEGLSVTTHCGARELQEVWRKTAPARYQTPHGPVWVLWVDEDYRTAALGRPDGFWGAVWNRAERIPADRALAAREILDFNGYDMASFQEGGL